MIRDLLAAAALPLTIAAVTVPAAAQQIPAPIVAITGTRLDVVATGEVRRVPDIATINAGVVTQAARASEAIRQNATRMASVRSALRRAGIPDRDIQTSHISLNPEYRYGDNQPPRLVGYQASNQVSVRFRDLAETGEILEALVAEGANTINGPSLSIDRPEEALDEARTLALANARTRAELYARALGMRVKRVLAVSEPGVVNMPPIPVMRMEAAQAQDASTRIDPGEQTLTVYLTVTFELE